MADTWPLTLELLRWSRRDAWTLEHACAGTFITGAIGSGKTTGPFQYISRSLLRAGAGALFLCAKVDAALEYRAMARDEGREHDVIHFRVGEHSFNFLTYEAKSSGIGRGIIDNIVEVLMQASEIASRKTGGKTDAFFASAMAQLLRNCLEVVYAATGEIDLQAVAEIVATLPGTFAAAEDTAASFALQILETAERRAGSDRHQDLKLARYYITKVWPNLATETRSSIAITLEVLLDSFLRYPLRDLFLGATTCSPDDILAGRIVIVDVPVNEFDLIGKIAGILWKSTTQRAIQRHPGASGEFTRPILLAADECQFWSVEADSIFQTTSRSSRAVTVYSTQNLSNIYAEQGADPTGRSRVDSLLGNLQTRVACQNSEFHTGKWYSETIGKIVITRRTVSRHAQKPAIGLEGVANFFSGLSSNESHAETLDYDVQPRLFTTLRTGGVGNRFRVEAIVTCAGRRFKASGKRWLRTTFLQRMARGSFNRFWRWFQPDVRISVAPRKLQISMESKP